ncbi:hypothetical protein ASPZODRAFT_157714 [Penicilliopsis zonata CBS 506.65]|uniref:Dynactin subunit n=1 Tax=Penicilliopsis zonata CBS 506.65 TaxID=1073090 RepID=A0A1L9SQE0_9EURO|nr:hypothetical protein ASPZODRAFT_157714 [Penicilliopsis zonata CBS 506.65]OJJ49303.1 hypothetical protein ASPZODRAFT_157714 [Penicilliopsis zonata CBS 506.65]
MAFNKKYAGLPDLDLAPDIYETPDLTDDVSTLPTATVRTASDSDDDLGSHSDIDRHGVNADEARAHFLGATVDARDVNFSDSIATKRKAYRSKTGRRRRRGDQQREAGDLSDSEDESFERKLTRLRREVEEMKSELVTRQAEAQRKETQGEAHDQDMGDGVMELSRALDNLHASSRNTAGPYSAAATLSQQISKGSLNDHSAAASKPSGPDGNSNTASQTSPSSPGVLSHAASFDGRLALIEAAMGISSASNPFLADGGSGSQPALQPILPALDHLTSRLSTLTSILIGPNPPASAVPTMGPAPPSTTYTTPHLESLSSRVRKLTADADSLASARRRAVDAAKAAQAARIAAATIDFTSEGMSVSSSSVVTPGAGAGGANNANTTTTTNNNNNNSEGQDPAASQRDEQAAKIQALYATLPTIQSLHPLLPSVLERLRSLRAVHAGAAQAADLLEGLEKRQAEMWKEIEQWREGLRVVEEKMDQGEAALKNNVALVEPWVRDLEGRLERLT